MFAYNELSDLLDGSLVTPIRKEGNVIIALNNGVEQEYNFEDFDFDKLPKDRIVMEVVDDLNVTIPEQEISFSLEEPVNVTLLRDTEHFKSHFIEDDAEKRKILNFFNLDYKKANILREM